MRLDLLTYFMELGFLIECAKIKALEPHRPGLGVVRREAMGDVDLFAPGQSFVAFLTQMNNNKRLSAVFEGGSRGRVDYLTSIINDESMIRGGWLKCPVWPLARG